MSKHDYACLVGNGLSVAYSAELAIPSLTTSLLAKFDELSGGEAETALRSFAAGFAGVERGTFEELLAPFEHVSRILALLPDLEPVAQVSAGASGAITTTIDFLDGLHRVGLSTILSAIDQYARATAVELYASVVPFSKGVHALRLNSNRSVALATLNYDGLLHAALLDQTPSDAWGVMGTAVCADLSAGYAQAMRRPFGTEDLPCWELRSTGNLPVDRSVHLLHLHGYLAWLWDPDEDRFWKFRLEDLRGAEGSTYWDALRSGTARMFPVVVLTDRKTQAVSDAPFSRAYELFGKRLYWADRWLLAGYSGNDEPVNAVLREQIDAKNAEQRERLRVLVLNRCGADEESHLQSDVAQLLGLDRGSILVDGTGLPDSVSSAAWSAWADA